MPNNYARLPDVLAGMGKVPGTSADAVLVRIIEAASRGFDGAPMLNRQVYPEWATRYLDGDGSRELLLDFDLLAVTALAVDMTNSGTYGTALVEGTHYRLGPRNRPNKRRIELLAGAPIAGWPAYPDSVRVTGQVGYRALSEATGQAVQNPTQLSASGTSLQVTSSTGLAIGDLLILEAEEVYVSAIPDLTSATIERAQNGTVAVAHAAGTAISRRRYPADIELACALQAERMYVEMRTGQGAQSADPAAGGFNFRSMYPQIQDLLKSHRWLAVY